MSLEFCLPQLHSAASLKKFVLLRLFSTGYPLVHHRVGRIVGSRTRVGVLARTGLAATTAATTAGTALSGAGLLVAALLVGFVAGFRLARLALPFGGVDVDVGGVIATLLTGNERYSYWAGAIAVVVFIYSYPTKSSWLKTMYRFTEK